MKKIFEPIIEEIEMKDKERVNQRWINKQKDIIDQEFTKKIEDMQAAEEEDIEVTEREAEKYVE
jgi:hypothetical protein